MKRLENIDELTLMQILLFIMGIDGLFEDKFIISRIIDIIALTVSIVTFIGARLHGKEL